MRKMKNQFINKLLNLRRAKVMTSIDQTIIKVIISHKWSVSMDITLTTIPILVTKKRSTSTTRTNDSTD